MRSTRTTVVVVALLAVGVTACGKGGGDELRAGRKLSEPEQKFADAFAKDLADEDDGFGVDATSGQCIGEAIMGIVGIKPFDTAELEPKDLAGDETPGELLGAGAVSQAQATDIVTAWNGCVDLPKVFAEQASGEFKLDAAGQSCFEGELRKSKVLDRYVAVSFTKDDADASRDVLQDIVGLVQGCSAQGGEGGVLVDSIAASLGQSGLIDAVESRCMAQAVVDTMGADHLLEVTKSGSFADAEPAVRAEFEAALRGAATTCDVPLSKLGG
jgi:hypothetical protein